MAAGHRRVSQNSGIVMAESPYKNLPARQFWKTGVANQTAPGIASLYRRKFEVRKDMKVMTAGSCFAQHIGVNMKRRGFSVMDFEPAPPGLSKEVAQSFGFSTYSARYGNIYTVRQLLQLAREAMGISQPVDPVWTRDDRFFDSQRPGVEPNGLASADLVRHHRAFHLRKVRELLTTADVLVFTLGLTEGWIDQESGTIFPTAPGTIAGVFDGSRHAFVNFGYESSVSDFRLFRDLLSEINPDVRLLLTVSPVPLTATAEDQHVLVATTYSKSVLRAVAGDLSKDDPACDYFPSYEIITSSYSQGRYFEPNLRSVSPKGVKVVMETFFAAHDPDGAAAKAVVAEPGRSGDAMPPPDGDVRDESGDDVVCEDALLEAFAVTK
jgi:hypothetical protein